MKRKSTRRLATVFLSLFLVCICLATLFVFPVSAAAASNNDYVYRTDYTTKDRKPTYTATLNENNKLLKELNKKENVVLKKVRNEGKDWVNDAFALANAIKNSSGGDVDWEKIGVEATKNIITSIAGIWGFDGIAGALLDGIESLTSSGQAPLSEVQVLSDDIDKRFNAISDQLYDIEEQLGSLSNQVTVSANDVLSGTQTQINNLEAKQILRSFMSSGEGNFSYLEYSNYLYGNKSKSVNASEAYYILLLEAIQSGASDEVVEYYYNKLFESVYTNIAIYNQYYYGEIAGLDKSMAAYYYDYLSYNPNLVDDGTSAEYQALLFALDLYTTYVYSYEILEMCFAYQATNMYLDASLENRNISAIDTYEYADGKLIMYSTIQAELANMQANLVLAEEQIAEDIAYILGMKDSYIAVDDNGNVHSIGNYGESFGNVANGQTVYLNIVPDEICELFTLNANKFRYYVNGAEYTGSNKAIVDVNKVHNDTFTTSVTYGNTEIYNIEFTKIDSINENSQKIPIYEFSGGSGTLDDPYLISNALQLYMVWDNLDASYQLISNIVVTGTHSPIGTEKKTFNGTFDGNGYSITNLTIESLPYDSTNIKMNPTTGMFGTIGRSGVVKNLTLKALNVVSNSEKDAVKPENDNSYYCIGGIAGTNRGVISNCTITTDSSISVSRSKLVQDSRTVSVYVGGIAGNNSGVIEYCTVDSLSIDATSYHYYYNESTSKNEHALYVGGIAAITNNTVQNCRVSENTSISAYAKSIADSKDDEKPILTVYVGGIIADDAAHQYISNVYSKCNIVKCQGDIYNEGTYWGEHRYSWDKVSVKRGLYYPVFFPLSNSIELEGAEYHFFYNEYVEHSFKLFEDLIKTGLNEEEARIIITTTAGKEVKAKLVEEEAKANANALTVLGEKVVSDYDNTIFTSVQADNDIEIVLTDNVCEINSVYLTNYFNKLIDEENGIANIKFVNKNGENVDATIVGYYGFNTYHESATAQTITVKVFFYVDDVLMSDDVSLVIKAKELVDWEIEGFIDTTFDKGVSSSACLDEIFKHGFKIVYIYSNGQREEFVINEANKNTVDIYNLITSEYGVKTITIYHNEQPNVGKLLKFEQTIEFDCHHTNSDFILDGTVNADCKFLGYEIWKCNKDGEGCGEVIHKNFVKGDHTYVVKSGQAATCHEAGYTQEVSCSVCGEVFESTEWIQALPHNYVSSSESGYKANDSYPAAEYHYCTNGDHYEAHQYTVSEYVDENGTLVYLYSCFCGYENPVPDYNIKTKENGEKPVVVVTNGYVLNVGDEVVVYVQIINNPGFKGATFGIRYDNGLELISADESMIVPQQLKVRNEVYNGYNFLWAEGDGNKTTEDGYLIKLTFRYIDEAEGEQHISIVYGMSNGSEGGFCTLDDGYHMFMTQSGTISVVEHLPGDVNNDEVVDIMDATYIAWSIVGKEDENGNKIQVNAKYADVNLDGKVDLLDVLAILQSISGRYGTSLLSSDYKLFFDLNGFFCNDIDESAMVEFYDENGNRTKWSENVDFVKYEALMKQLGYTFVGWYTRMDCTCTGTCIHVVEVTDYITYDKYQGNQTLYARWEKNKIIFDMGGADCEQFDEITYSKSEHENAQVTLDKPVWSYDIDYIVDGTSYDNGRIYKDFLGWKDENGNFVTTIDLSKENIGTIKLTAVWSEYKWVMPDRIDKGYHSITEWFADEYRINEITNINANNIVNSIVNNGCKIYGNRTPVKYTITYENTHDVVNSNETEYDITSDTIRLFDLPSYTGYDFDYWMDANGNKVTSIVKGTTENITLTAKWKAKVYTITVQGMDVNPSNQTDSNGNPKYNSKSFGTLYYTYGDDTHEQGFYVDAALANKLSTNHFAEYCENTQGKTNFNFGGLFTSIITNNGHTYATYTSNSCVLSSDFALFTTPILSEDSRAGTVYVLLIPKQYTITLNANTSSQVALATTNNFTTSMKAYYNEKPSNIAVMPEGNYYVPTAYESEKKIVNGVEVGGIAYFSNTGASTRYYDFSGDTTMYCSWTQKYSGTYIHNGYSIDKIRDEIGQTDTYYIIENINWSKEWTPISTFSGTINGLDHKITGLQITSWHGNFGFIGTLSGTVCNLTFESAYMSYEGGESQKTAAMGVVCGINNGTIDNVKVYSSDLTCVLGSTNWGGKSYKVYAGLIAGGNNSTIKNCHVYTSSIYGDAHTKDEDGDAYVGGIVGWSTAGSIANCTVNSCTKIRARAWGAHNEGFLGIGGWSARLDAYAGGIAGFAEGTAINNCHVDTASENALQATAHEAESKYNRAAKNAIVGSGSGNTITNSD